MKLCSKVLILAVLRVTPAVCKPRPVSLVANAEGESPVIAPNTWVEVKGANLSKPAIRGSGRHRIS
jgi:hypothetical protein